MALYYAFSRGFAAFMRNRRVSFIGSLYATHVTYDSLSSLHKSLLTIHLCVFRLNLCVTRAGCNGHPSAADSFEVVCNVQRRR